MIAADLVYNSVFFLKKTFFTQDEVFHIYINGNNVLNKQYKNVAHWEKNV